MVEAEEGKGKEMTKHPIRVDPTVPRHHLDKASRVNYAKLYTVEYNTKVWFVGKIHKDSAHQFAADYNEEHKQTVPMGYN